MLLSRVATIISNKTGCWYLCQFSLAPVMPHKKPQNKGLKQRPWVRGPASLVLLVSPAGASLREHQLEQPHLGEPNFVPQDSLSGAVRVWFSWWWWWWGAVLNSRERKPRAHGPRVLGSRMSPSYLHLILLPKKDKDQSLNGVKWRPPFVRSCKITVKGKRYEETMRWAHSCRLPAFAC